MPNTAQCSKSQMLKCSNAKCSNAKCSPPPLFHHQYRYRIGWVCNDIRVFDICLLVNTVKCQILPNAQMLKYSNAQMLKRSNAQTLKCSNAQTLKRSITQMLKCSNAQTLKRQMPNANERTNQSQVPLPLVRVPSKMVVQSRWALGFSSSSAHQRCPPRVAHRSTNSIGRRRSKAARNFSRNFRSGWERHWVGTTMR